MSMLKFCNDEVPFCKVPKDCRRSECKTKKSKKRGKKAKFNFSQLRSPASNMKAYDLEYHPANELYASHDNDATVSKLPEYNSRRAMNLCFKLMDQYGITQRTFETHRKCNSIPIIDSEPF